MKTETSIPITVVMPVYNGEKYLQKAIDSILNQTFTDFEFLIIDDGSTDNTESIIRSYTDARIKYVKNEKNSGVSFSANRGFKEAKGNYIIRMDADDISFPNRLEKQYAFMESHKDFAACCSNVIYMSEDEKRKNKPWAKDASLPAEWLLCFNNPIPQPAICIRKTIIHEYNLEYNTNIRLAEDYDLWTRIASIGKIHRMNEVLLYYRELSTSAFHSNMKTTFENASYFNTIYVSQLTHNEIPYFHTYLTRFCLKENRSKDFIEVQKLQDWLDVLCTILSSKWNWNSKTKKRVKKDYNRILVNFAVTLQKKCLIKNIHKFWKLGPRFYIAICIKTIKYVWLRVRKKYAKT